MTDNRVMHKRELVDEVARRSGPWGLTRRQGSEALHSILDVITDEMAEGNAVTIAGFGRFVAKEQEGQHQTLGDVSGPACRFLVPVWETPTMARDRPAQKPGTRPQAGSPGKLCFWRGYRRRPQGASNARHVATLAGLQTQRELCLVWRESVDGRG